MRKFLAVGNFENRCLLMNESDYTCPMSNDCVCLFVNGLNLRIDFNYPKNKSIDFSTWAVIK